MENEKTKNLLKKATGVVCRQGIIPFPVSDAAVQIIDMVAGDRAEELELICAFQDRSSQTLEELVESSGFDTQKAAMLADRLAGKGLIFNQPSSSGVMVYRLLPFMVVGLMEYMFMGELKGTQKERKFADLFEQMTRHLRQENFFPY